MMDVPALLRGTGNGVCQICNREAMELEKEIERVETEKEKEKDSEVGSELEKSISLLLLLFSMHHSFFIVS